MIEQEFVKLIVQGGAVGIAAGLIVLLGVVIINAFRRDARESREREQLVGLLETVLTRQASTFQAGLATLTDQMQREYRAGLGTLTQAVERMAQSTQQRDTAIKALHSDVRTVPSETVRLLEPALTDLRAALEKGIGEIETHLTEQLAAQGAALTPAMRAMFNQEMQQYHTQIQRQLDNLTALVVAVRGDLAEREGADVTVVTGGKSQAQQSKPDAEADEQLKSA